jgi:hypothetical protein
MSEKENLQKVLRRLGEDFLKALREEVDSYVLLCDVDRLHGLIRQVDIYLGYRLIHDLREKGLGEELKKLCVARKQEESGND